MRTLERGLTVLDALGEHDSLTLQALHDMTALPKSTLLRVLATLEKTGHARRRIADRSWRRTALRSPSTASAVQDQLIDIGGEVLDEMCARLAWPSDLAVYHDGAMEILETTRRKSPYVMNRLAIGFRVPVLLSGLGRAWLAFCPDEERAAIVAALTASNYAFDRTAQDPGHIAALVSETRAKGYGIRADGYSVRRSAVEDKTSGIALPIYLRGRIVACINLVWVLTAFDEDAFVRRYLGELRNAAGSIGQRLECQASPRPV
ncbi:IclR family transcriptional regulator domain-containing protein [Pseudorhodoplanes sp.]|uniref:IclR family transcriptional regulator domain-containing protein n=1 Tax=Pseudorhodoplanes sp. TaxID=1934341 RepID=UPI003D12C395